MNTPRSDELIRAPTRLALVAFLAATGWALSKQLTTLEGAGHIEICTSFVGKRPRAGTLVLSARVPEPVVES